MLVTNAGQLVEKDELLREVWPDTFVEEASLSQNIFLLRRILGDERNGPRFIETVVRRGYRFVADVRVVDAEEQPGEDLQPVASVAPRPVVAVLPFLNTTGNPELEYLADGVTDNIINSLCRVSQLRVMSHSAVGRYKLKSLDPQQAGRDLGASAVLVGRIHSVGSAIAVSVELVEVSTGWQLWGESFDSQRSDILEIQDAITRQMLAALKLKLTGEEEKRVTARYTENAEAYQLYLEGRYHWSRYTRKGIEKAIGHFRKAIELDPNYALAYAAIVDCYLRLATNYLPPEEDVPTPASELSDESKNKDEEESRVRLRFEWDWKGVERELRRANELKTTYPSAHQWYAAYRFAKQLYEKFRGRKDTGDQIALNINNASSFHRQMAYFELIPSEQLQVYCAIAREQIDVGNYEAACKILRPWWSYGDWPRLGELNQQTCADLLLTIGELAGYVASTKQLPRGQRHGEELLNGSIALFEQLGFSRRAAAARIELALCYYRQGLFDIGRSTLIRVLNELSDTDWELRSLALIRLASLERHAGKLRDALSRLTEASAGVELAGPWATARSHLEVASIYKDLAVSEDLPHYFDEAKLFYFKALHQFEAVGHHRYVAAVENNIGFLLLNLGAHETATKHLLRARRLFESLSDCVRGAQVNDTLARLYVQMKQYDLAQQLIEHAVKILELTDSEALLAEALVTKGVVLRGLRHYSEAKNSFEAAYRVAERCGDKEGAGRSLLIMYEEMAEYLEKVEESHISQRLKALLADTQQTTLKNRVKRVLAKSESGSGLMS